MRGPSLHRGEFCFQSLAPGKFHTVFRKCFLRCDSDRILAATAGITTWVRVRATSISCWFNLLIYCLWPSFPHIMATPPWGRSSIYTAGLRSLQHRERFLTTQIASNRFKPLERFPKRVTGGFEPMPPFFEDIARPRGDDPTKEDNIVVGPALCPIYLCACSCRPRRQPGSIILRKVGAAAPYCPQPTQNGALPSQMACGRFHSTRIIRISHN